MSDIERNLGPQPLLEIMSQSSLKPHDLVVASSEHLNHKMVSRGCKGRRLTENVQRKILNALNGATGENYQLKDLFNYTKG